MAGDIPSDEVTPTYGWYGTGSASTFILNNVNDLYGFANIVNGKDGKTADSFAGKTVKLGANIDLTGKVWTPIGEGVRKNPQLVTYADLKAADLKSANLGGYEFTEDEAYFINLLENHEPVEIRLWKKYYICALFFC